MTAGGHDPLLYWHRSQGKVLRQPCGLCTFTTATTIWISTKITAKMAAPAKQHESPKLRTTIKHDVLCKKFCGKTIQQRSASIRKHTRVSARVAHGQLSCNCFFDSKFCNVLTLVCSCTRPTCRNQADKPKSLARPSRGCT